MKIWRVIESQNDKECLQRDIGALYDWATKNKMHFHPDKCKVIRLTLNRKTFK